uniref:Uncharacterized protein n=1 Tax=Oryza glumipatula TaxID=40148 RepID=A0A0E0BIT3_9ORYZ
MGIFRCRSKEKRSKGKYLVEDKTGFAGSSMRWLSGNENGICGCWRCLVKELKEI